MEGWILLHRKIQENPIWASELPFDRRSAWVDLLMLANHADVETVFDYEPFIVRRGQYLTSVRKLSIRWSWSKDRTLKFLRLLETLGMIRRESNNQRTLLTIVNYDVYQYEPDTNKDTRRTRSSTRSGHDSDTGKDTGSPQTNNEKNVNNEKNEKNIYGEYKHVRLTARELERLFADYGEAETMEAIKFLDEYIQRKGYKAKDHNLTLRKWVFKAVQIEKGKDQGNVFDAWANA